jgi:hypothetical protein
VGENSTGKTSFLAALRYCFNLTEPQKGGYFNTFPFDLGSYEDIVHQSGQSSTAHRFSITVENDVDISRGGALMVDPKAKPDVRRCSIRVFFGSRFGEVALSSFLFKFDATEIEYKAGEKGDISVRHEGRDLPKPDRQTSFGFPESRDGGADDLRNIRYRIYDFFFYWAQKNDRKNRRNIEIMSQAAQAFDSFISSTYALHSSPPVRSVPRRVYTSSDEGGFSDQTHAPHELNRLKRADRRRWGHLNAGLTRFGKLSGLFTRFDITKLTRQDAGPFQLKVTVRGRASNIADVGYGVSQSLPIMTDLIESTSDKSVFLFQQPEVHLHPRAQAALGTVFSDYIASHRRSYIVTETHSDYLINRVRIQIRKGEIHPDLVSLLYFEPSDSDVNIYEVSIDRKGNIIGAPPSYRQFFIAEEEEVLDI